MTWILNAGVMPRRHACLLFNDEVLDALSVVKPEDVSAKSLMLDRWWVKSVKSFPDLGDDPIDFWDGMAKLPVRALWRFWGDADNPDSMQWTLLIKDGIYDSL
ncbi:hypothetical protein BDV06DRAFT_226789 [Aspergillus oleicola]